MFIADLNLFDIILYYTSDTRSAPEDLMSNLANQSAWDKNRYVKYASRVIAERKNSWNGVVSMCDKDCAVD